MVSLCSINRLPFTLKHSGLLGTVLFFLTYQIIIGQNGKGQIKLTINQIRLAKLAFECDPGSGCCACGMGCVCKVEHQGMS